MKKTAITLTTALMLGGLVGCGVGNSDNAANNDDNNGARTVQQNDKNNLLGARNVTNDDTTTNDGTATNDTGTNDGTGTDGTTNNDTGENDGTGTDGTTTNDTGENDGTGTDGTETTDDNGVEDDELEGIGDDNGEEEGEEFEDLDLNAWYVEDVRLARDLGLVQGNGKNQFKPNKPLTRAEMAAILRNMVENGYLNMEFMADNR
jgi:hypothetical protein